MQWVPLAAKVQPPGLFWEGSPLCAYQQISFLSVTSPLPCLFPATSPASFSFCLLLHPLRRGKAFPGLRAVLCSLCHFTSGQPAGDGSSPRRCALPTPPYPHLEHLGSDGATALFSKAPSCVQVRIPQRDPASCPTPLASSRAVWRKLLRVLRSLSQREAAEASWGSNTSPPSTGKVRNHFFPCAVVIQTL